MAYEWGKYINGEVFIEDPIIINNGNIISTEKSAAGEGNILTELLC